MKIDHFLGQFTTRSCQISPEMHMPSKNTNMYITDLQSKLRDFQKKMSHYENLSTIRGDLISNRSYSKSFICSDKIDGLKKYCLLSDFVLKMHLPLKQTFTEFIRTSC